MHGLSVRPQIPKDSRNTQHKAFVRCPSLTFRLGWLEFSLLRNVWQNPIFLLTKDFSSEEKTTTTIHSQHTPKLKHFHRNIPFIAKYHSNIIFLNQNLKQLKIPAKSQTYYLSCPLLVLSQNRGTLTSLIETSSAALPLGKGSLLGVTVRQN